MNTLSTLLPLWADAAPDECREAGTGVYYLPGFGGHVNTDESKHGCALILGALYVAAAERSMYLDTALCDNARPGMECSASVRPEGAPYYIHRASYTEDPTEALCLVTVGALSCYLRALGVDIPTTP
jgi:hypothetical protein